jgi:predicted dehydrogenase
MKPLRTAILGCGSIAKRHADILATLDDVRLVGYCDQNVAAAQEFAKRYAPGKVYEHWEPMFAELDLDLVYICLPPFAHADEVAHACRHGVHIFIEKPIALTSELARGMARDVSRSGVKCQVGFMYRFGEAALWLKERIGDPTGARAFMVARYSCNSLHSSWWRDRARSGGQLVEQAIHLLDLARFFLGEPEAVYSSQQNLFHAEVEGYTVEDASATVIRFPSTSLAVVAATNGAIPGRWDCDWRIVLPGLTADFADPNHATIHSTASAWPSVTTLASEKNMYRALTLDLLEAIRQDRPPAVPIEEGVRSLELALAATLSAQQQTEVQTGAPVAG